MIVKKVDGQLFKELIISGAKNLRLNYKEVDDLNVFPVPDGDTGTNMCHTIEGGVNNIRDIDSNNLSDIAKPLLTLCISWNTVNLWNTANRTK